MPNMTRKKSRNLEKSLRKMFHNVGLVVFNRDDVYNQTKIHELQNKMDEKSLFDAKTFNNSSFLCMNSKKISLRSSKGY